MLLEFIMIFVIGKLFDFLLFIWKGMLMNDRVSLQIFLVVFWVLFLNCFIFKFKSLEMEGGEESSFVSDFGGGLNLNFLN